jgi:hypothetical protein
MIESRPSRRRLSVCLEARETGLGLSTCIDDPAQHWVYDRKSGHISTTDLGKCLQISCGIHAFGENFPVNIDDCFDDDWQEWTYDPETKVLLSAMGPVLTSTNNYPFQWPFPGAGDRIQSSPLRLIGGHNDIVFHAENNDVVSFNQQWLADQPTPCPTAPWWVISPSSSIIGCLPIKSPSK